MKILVTGAKGQLGRSIQDLVHVFPQHEFLFTDIEELDITDSESLEAFFSKNKPDLCVNCAAYTAVDKAEEQQEFAWLINEQAVINLRDASLNQHAYLIHISTDYVFNGRQWTPYQESDPVAPDSAYGKSKADGEKALEGFSHCLILRTSWLYSEYGKNFFKTMHHLLGIKEELSVVFDQIGTPTYAGDLALAILNIAGQLDNGHAEPGIFHYSNEGVASWYDFTQEIKSLMESNCHLRPIESSDYPLPAPRPFYSVLNKARIKSVYQLEIPHWKESLNKCYQSFQSKV